MIFFYLSLALGQALTVERAGSYCAGVLIGGEIWTSYHCVVGHSNIRYRSEEGQAGRAKVLWLSPKHDLARLAPREPLAETPLHRASGPPRVGTDVIAVGHPYGSEEPFGFFTGTLRHSSSYGKISAVGDRALQLDMMLYPGNSGGPILDDTDQVVAIASRKFTRIGPSFASRIDEQVEIKWRKKALMGHFAVEPLVSVLDAEGWSVGGRGELAFFDSIFVTAKVQSPISAVLKAARFGEAVFAGAGGGGGLRRNWGRGGTTLTTDVEVGVTTVHHRTSAADHPLEQRVQHRYEPTVGGRLRFRGLGVGAFTTIDAQSLIIELSLWQPGVLFVF